LDVTGQADSLIATCFAYATLFTGPARKDMVNEMLVAVRSRCDLALRAMVALTLNQIPVQDVLSIADAAGLQIGELRAEAEALIASGILPKEVAPAIEAALAHLGPGTSPNRSTQAPA
jgi:hypothetical protein